MFFDRYYLEESDMDPERLVQQASELLNRFGVADQYQVIPRPSPNHLANTITILHRKSGTAKSYSTVLPSGSPRYWLVMLERELAEGTFSHSYDGLSGTKRVIARRRPLHLFRALAFPECYND
jgi:hypothetical protein